MCTSQCGRDLNQTGKKTRIDGRHILTIYGVLVSVHSRMIVDTNSVAPLLPTQCPIQNSYPNHSR